MERYLVIEGGVVVNVIACDAAFANSIGAVLATDSLAGIGWLYDGTTFTPPPTPVLTISAFDAALTAHLDATAQARRYDNRITCALRAGYTGPFQAEGQAFAAWMDTCNATAYTLLAEVQAGTRELPVSTQALIDMLPPMVWPT